jgi:hypothetical protein
MFEPVQGLHIARDAEASAKRRQLRRNGFAMHLIGGLLAVASSALPAVDWQVDTATDSVDALPGDGFCRDAANSQCSLRAALMEANALPGADRILLPAGTFGFERDGRGENSAATGDLDILDAVDIIGAGSALSIVDGMAIDRVIEIHTDDGDSVRLQGLTLRNGRDDTFTSFTFAGIGLDIHSGAEVTLSDIVVRDQRSLNGFAVLGINNLGCLRGSRVRILDNRLIDPNAVGPAPRVGGMRASGAGACLELEDFEFRDNGGTSVGALYVDTDVHDAHLRRGLIVGNTGTVGSAIHVDLGNDVLLENVTLSGNGINNDRLVLNDGFSVLRMLNCTVVGNRGSLMDVHGVPRILLTNTVMAASTTTPPFPNRLRSESGGNLIASSAEYQLIDQQSDDQMDIDPQLGPLDDFGGFTQAHRIGPAAIDRGSTTVCAGHDQRLQLRPQDGDLDGIARCDIGAVEMWADALFAGGFE